VQWRNLVMFVVYIGSILTLGIQALAAGRSACRVFSAALWLWFTVLFANPLLALAEAQQGSSVLRKKKSTIAKN
jgi:K+-transporting ATPase ATPase B chain